MKTALVILMLVALSASAQQRMVQGKVYDWNDPKWTIFNCNLLVITNIGNDPVCQPYKIVTIRNGPYVHSPIVKTEKSLYGSAFCLRNYGSASVGADIYPPIRAIPTGSIKATYNIRTGGTIDAPSQKTVSYSVYDMGVPYSRPLTPEEKLALQKKKAEAETNAVKWLQSEATNGSASAQCSLGLHYLNGQGCETNKTLAIYWLQQASAQGDLEASNKLAELK